MIGYAVSHKPHLASYRLRVAVPAPHLGVPYVIGDVGSPTFFYKLGNPEIAARCRGVLFDVVNDHFEQYPTVKAMGLMADVLTAGSAVMADVVRKHTGRDAVVIDDPYENDEGEAKVVGQQIVWFGHGVNLPSLSKLAPSLKGFRVTICTNVEHPAFVIWSPESEKAYLDASAVVVVSGTNPGASSNRPAKAIRAGRFVVMPEDCAESWRQFRDYAWIGDVREGVRWALNNREEACKRIKAGQKYVRERFDPVSIGRQWKAAFDSISAPAISDSRDGLTSTSLSPASPS